MEQTRKNGHPFIDFARAAGVKITAVLIFFCLLASLVSCATTEPGPGSSADPGPVTSPDTSNSAPEPDREDFTDLPDLQSPVVNVIPGNKTLLFSFSTPGMESEDRTLVLYSLTDKRTVAKVDLGNGLFSVQTEKGGGFSVFEPSGNGGECSVYGADGTLTEVRQISCLNGEAGFLLTDPETGVSIASEPSTGSCRLLSPDGNLLSGPDLQAGFYEPVGCANGQFVLNESGQKTVLVHPDGQVRTLFAKGTSDVLNDRYAAGRTGDHLCFLPLDESGWLFVPVAGTDERFVSANQAGFLTVETKENRTVVRLYRMTNLTVLEETLPEEVAAAALTDNGRVALVLRKEDESGYAYRMLETEDWQERTVYTENDLSAVLGAVSLPEIGNTDEADRFAKEILEKYNVRFLYEPCDLIEELVAAGLASDLSEDRGAVRHAEEAVAETFSFLPDEVWKGIGNGLPYVVILCKALPGNVGGWNFEWGGYNCTFVEIGGNDAYLQHLFVHETGHAIIRSLSHTDPGQSFLAEWTALTPEDVLEAVEKGTADGKNAITVEFTPDDKSGNVCYVSPYAMKNPEEDRAETLAAFYSGPFAGTDENLFTENCPVLRAKAAFWGTMIRRAFQLADSVALPLDSIE